MAYFRNNLDTSSIQPLMQEEETSDYFNVTVLNSKATCWKTPSDIEYQEIKKIQFDKELLARRTLILEGLLPLMLDQQCNYPKTSNLYLAWIKFGASLVDKELAKISDINLFEKASHSLPHAGFQRLLKEMSQEANQ